MLALMILIRTLDSSFLSASRRRGFDLEQQLAPRSYQDVRVRVVAIDEKSLARYGQWPWPRTLVAQLVNRISTGNPLVLGMDILFSEQDRCSPAAVARSVPGISESIVRDLDSLPEGDRILADAFRKTPTVLGVATSPEAVPAGSGPSPVTLVRQSGADPRPFLSPYRRLLRSLPELTAAEIGRGEIVVDPDPDGILRRLPLFIEAGGNVVPSLSLDMLRVESRAGSIGIVAAPDGIVGATLGKFFIPTDRRARAYPYFTQFADRRQISAADLLDGSYDPAALRGGIVLLGVTGLGLVDQYQTPLGLMHGVDIEGQLIESILTRNLLRRPSIMDMIEITVAFAAGLLIIFAVPYGRPPIAGMAFVVLVLLILGSAFASFRLSNVLFDGAFPAFTAIATYGVMLAASLRAAESAPKRLATDLASEREAQARLEGELGAARAIQMGLLPRRFPAFPDRHDFDIYAAIEPARMVGGDFYDFVLLDSKLLSFAIADVSGEGVPAALFMAMTKDVLRAATLRHGRAIDLMFEEVNAKVLAAGSDMAVEGADMMFVTVFAGVLDLASGKLIYVNAGHQSPFVLKPDAGTRQLRVAGGPPLGTVNDFHYFVEEEQLGGGELLLLYTDGVTGSEDPNHSFYSTARLERLLASGPVLSAKAVVDFVRDDVRNFAGAAEQADDITLLGIRWLGAEAPAG